jgi:hypothetical protein
VFSNGNRLFYLALIGALALILLSPRSASATTYLTIGDFVWHDLDGDGRQDSGKPGISGVAEDSSPNGGHNPDKTGDYTMPSGDDGSVENDVVVSLVPTTTVHGQNTALDTPVADGRSPYRDNSELGTIDFGLISSPNAVLLQSSDLDNVSPTGIVAFLAVFTIGLVTLLYFWRRHDRQINIPRRLPQQIAGD